MSPRRLILLAFLLMLVMLGLVARPVNAQDGLARIRARGEITMAVDPTSPPFDNREGDKLEGFDIDLGDALAKELGVKAHWVPMEWSGVFAAVTTGKVDVVFSGVTITEERKKGYAFTRPYFPSGQALARRKGDLTVTTPEKLVADGHSAVAVQQETTGQYAMEKRGMPADRIHKYDTLQDGLLDVRNGRAAAAVADLPTLRETLRKGYPELEVVPGGTFVTEYLGIVARPADTELVAALNIALNRVFVNGNYAAAYQKWMREPATADLIARLDSAKNEGTSIPKDVAENVAKELDRTEPAIAGDSGTGEGQATGSAFAIRTDLLAKALPLLLQGAGLTLELTLLTLILGIPLGLLLSLTRLSSVPVMPWLAAVYIEAVRGTPLLMQIYVIYFVLPALHVSLPPFAAGVAALTLNSAAYVAEIFRAGIESIDPGQREAARALGMTGAQAMRWVILPQTIRRVLPPITNEAVALLKDSSLVSVVALAELMRVGKEIATNAGSPTTIYLAVALLYLVMTLPLTAISRKLEARLGTSRRKKALRQT